MMEPMAETSGLRKGIWGLAQSRSFPDPTDQGQIRESAIFEGAGNASQRIDWIKEDRSKYMWQIHAPIEANEKHTSHNTDAQNPWIGSRHLISVDFNLSQVRDTLPVVTNNIHREILPKDRVITY
jgi:hypothetical protein